MYSFAYFLVPTVKLLVFSLSEYKSKGQNIFFLKVCVEVFNFFNVSMDSKLIHPYYIGIITQKCCITILQIEESVINTTEITSPFHKL